MNGRNTWGKPETVLNSMIEIIDLDSSFERIAFKTF